MRKKLFKAFMLFFLTSPTFAVSEVYNLKVKLDGLACPFCAYGLERKLKDYKGIQNLKILVDEGLATFQYPYGKIPDVIDLRQRVKKGGFTPREISINVHGSIKKINNVFFLFMDGLASSFALYGKTKGIQEGMTIQVMGILTDVKEKGHAEHPLRIKVESWQKQ